MPQPNHIPINKHGCGRVLGEISPPATGGRCLYLPPSSDGAAGPGSRGGPRLNGEGSGKEAGRKRKRASLSQLGTEGRGRGGGEMLARVVPTGREQTTQTTQTGCLRLRLPQKT